MDPSTIRFPIYPTFAANPPALCLLSDLTYSLLPSFSSNSPRMGSDDSTQTVFNTISNFNKSDVETPLTQNQAQLIFCNTFQPINPQPMKPLPSPTHTLMLPPILSPMSSDQPNARSPMTITT